MIQIIVDTCALASVFKPSTSDHSEFIFVKRAVDEKKGFLAWGGTKYINELQACSQVLALFVELSKSNRAKCYSKNRVDECSARLREQIPAKDFDDPHILALQIVSNADVICSKDIRMVPFLKLKSIYPKKHKRARFYSGARHRKLVGY